MPVVLMVLSLLATMVGFVAIAWGMFNQTLDNNTLIVGGTISAATGLALIALAAMVERLRRINEIIEARAANLGHPAEFVEATSMMTQRTAVGPPPVPMQARKADWSDGATPRPLWTAEQPQMPAPLETKPVSEMPGEAPLSRPAQPMTAPATSIDLSIRPSRSEQSYPAEQDAGSSFEVIRSGAAKNEPPRRRPQPATRPRPLGSNATEFRPGGLAIAAIFKSGVIEGRPYTLYADGSIVVDLPQGQMKFASAEALRLHIEKKNRSGAA
jgi:hypothetical protein